MRSRLFRFPGVAIPIGLMVIAIASCSERDELMAPPPADWDWSGIMTGPPVLMCTPSPANFLSTVSCLITLPPGAGSHLVSFWEFWGQSGEYVQYTGDGFGLGWTGPMVKSGTVYAHINVDGIDYSPSANVTINRRSGWTWRDSVGGTSGGLPDACIEALPGVAGLTSGQSCTAGNPNALFTPASVQSSGGYTSAPVSGSGPNGGLRYIQQPTITMQLRTQVRRNFRSDANPNLYPMAGASQVTSACGPQQRTIHYVNTTCLPVPAFSAWVAYIWDHEAKHVQLALDSAKVVGGAGDLHARWEPLVGSNDAHLRLQAEQQRVHAQNYVEAMAACSHTGGTSPTFNIWYNNQVEWFWAQLQGDESKPGWC